MTQHEEILERAIIEALSDIDLEAVAEVAGVAAITDSDGDAVSVNEMATLEAAGFMTTNRGVLVRLNDGAELTVTINVYRGPRG